jgi:anti-sigma factor RsiW
MAETEEFSCAELVELVTDYLEGALSPADKRRFEEHLLVCEGCGAYLDQIRKTIEIVGALTEESLTEAARNRLLEEFRDWSYSRGR